MSRPAFLPLSAVRAELYRGFEPVKPSERLNAVAVAELLPESEDPEPRDTIPAPPPWENADG